MSEEDEVAEEIELAQFGERALREPKGGAFERLLCQHLVLAVTSDPLNSIIHTCRAALSLPKKATDQLGIDTEKTKRILTVALNFQQAERNEEKYSLIWSFSKQGKKGFEKYIKPWLTTALNFALPYEFAKDSEALEEFKSAEISQQFYIASKFLTPTGFRTLLSAFVSWAYPFVEELAHKVSTQVSPTTYSEILSMFTKFKGEEEH